jgi:hypothetical protein
VLGTAEAESCDQTREPLADAAALTRLWSWRWRGSCFSYFGVLVAVRRDAEESLGVGQKLSSSFGSEKLAGVFSERRPLCRYAVF